MTDEFRHLNRRSIRLKGYDYSQAGAYFVSLVSFERECILGEVRDREVVLSAIGVLVAALWQAIPVNFAVSLGDWSLLSNHLHGIIILQPGVMGIAGSDPGIQGTSGGRGEASGKYSIFGTWINFPDASPLRAPSGVSSDAPSGAVFGAPPGKWNGVGNPKEQPNGTTPGSLGAVIQNFKSITTRRVNGLRRTPGEKLWQRNYYEHIIRNEEDWDRISRYILANPEQWEEDENFPQGWNRLTGR